MEPPTDADGRSAGPVDDDIVRHLLEAGRDQRWITEVARYEGLARIVEEDANLLDRLAEGPTD